MYYVYLLKDKQGKIYIGYTENLKRRLIEHQSGKAYWTRRMDAFSLLYYEAFNSKEVARRREKQLKKYGAAYYGLLKRIE